MNEVHQLLIAEVEEVLEVDAPEGELLEGAFPGGGLSVPHKGHRISLPSPIQVESRPPKRDQFMKATYRSGHGGCGWERRKREERTEIAHFALSFFRGPLLPGFVREIFLFPRLFLALSAIHTQAMDFEEAPEELPNNPGDYEGVDGRSTGLELCRTTQSLLHL